MEPRESQTLLAPLLLHASQLDAADATALEMSSSGAMGPRVSRSWALRELLTVGVVELAARLDAVTLTELRAPSPHRGKPRNSGDGLADCPPTSTFHVLSPMVVPRSLVETIRGLVPRVAHATGRVVTLSMVLREAMLLGYERRQRARRDALEKFAKLQSLLELAGGPEGLGLDLQIVTGSVVTPYLPPGVRSRQSRPDPAPSRSGAKPKKKKSAAKPPK